MPTPAPPSTSPVNPPAKPAGGYPSHAIAAPSCVIYADGSGFLWASPGYAVAMYDEDTAPVILPVSGGRLAWREADGDGYAWLAVQTDKDGVVTSSTVAAGAALPVPYRHRPEDSDFPGDPGQVGLYVLPLAILGRGFVIPILAGAPALVVYIRPSGATATWSGLGGEVVNTVRGLVNTYTPP